MIEKIHCILRGEREGGNRRHCSNNFPLLEQDCEHGNNQQDVKRTENDPENGKGEKQRKLLANVPCVRQNPEKNLHGEVLEVVSPRRNIPAQSY
jgi:hypothetical protein